MRTLQSFLWILAGMVNLSGVITKTTKTSATYTATFESIGQAIYKFASRETCVRLGYNPKSKTFAFIVSKVEVDPATIKTALPKGYLEIAAIQHVLGSVPLTKVMGNVGKFMYQPEFLNGIQSIIAHGFVSGGAIFRHNTTDAKDLVVVQIMTDIDYTQLSESAIRGNVVKFTTTDSTPILLMTDTKGHRYFATAYGIHTTEKLTVASAYNTFETKGKVNTFSFDSVIFNSPPVSMINTSTGFIVGLEDQQNWAFAVDAETGEITDFAVADSELGAIISLSFKMGTVIYDDGNTMEREQIIDIDPDFRRVAGMGVAMGTTTNKETTTDIN